MHPLLSSLRSLVAYLLAWGLAGAMLAGALVHGLPAGWGWALAFSLPTAWLTAVLALAMLYVCRSRPLSAARWFGGLASRASAAAVLAVATAGAAALWNATGQVLGRAGLVSLPPSAWIAMVLVLVLVFSISALVHDAALSQQALQEAASFQARASLQAREMELQALRSQVDPHFLFNSLNSISALTQLDARAARAMTIDLAQFFRQSLATSGRDLIPLAEELDLVQSYVAIEQRRLGGRLGLSVEAAEGCDRALVPPLLLQPLVENAVKHGIRGLEEGGCILLRAWREGPRLALTLANPVDGSAPPDGTGLGRGLKLLRERLAMQSPAPGFAEVESEPGLYTVRISLPWQT